MNDLTGRGTLGVKHPLKDQDHGAASSSLAGSAGSSASSALILRARAFRAWLEPLIPLLLRARRDTGFPAAISLLAIRRAWLIPAAAGVRVLAAVPWTALVPGQNSGSQSIIDI
jgi:hypothetical protein